MFLDYNIDMTKAITISGLAVRLFLKDFYKDNIPNISKASIYKDIRQAYYVAKQGSLKFINPMELTYITTMLIHYTLTLLYKICLV